QSRRMRVISGLTHEPVETLTPALQIYRDSVALLPQSGRGRDELSWLLLGDCDAAEAAYKRALIVRGMSAGRGGAAKGQPALALVPPKSVLETLGLPGTKHHYRVDLAEPARLVLRLRGPDDGPTTVELTRRGERGARRLKGAALAAGEDVEWHVSLGAASYG